MITFPNSKINIGLNVVEKRKDGFHNIETIFYPVALGDILEFIEKQAGAETTFNNTGLKVGDNFKDNLVIKAYNLLKEQFQLPSLSFHLHKIIPMGAGLGGGSSDAAYTLKSLNISFKLGLSDDDLENFASKLGSDCPFFIRNKPVFAYEKGNVFREINLSLSSYKIVIVYPAIHVSTPEAYALVTPAKPETPLYDLIKKPVNFWKDLIKNDFEVSVFKKHPEIEKIKDELYNLGAVYASMSGSGSAVYGIFEELPVFPESFNKYFIWKDKI